MSRSVIHDLTDLIDTEYFNRTCWAMVELAKEPYFPATPRHYAPRPWIGHSGRYVGPPIDGRYYHPDTNPADLPRPYEGGLVRHQVGIEEMAHPVGFPCAICWSA